MKYQVHYEVDFLSPSKHRKEVVMSRVYTPSTRRSLCAVSLLATVLLAASPVSADVSKDQVFEAANSYIRGLIPGNEFLTVLENADAIAVAIIDVRANLLQKQILLDELSGKISSGEADEAFNRLEQVKSKAQDAKNRALGGHPNQGTDPFGAKFMSSTPVDPTGPFSATFTMVPGTSSCHLVNPAIWGHGTTEVHVSDAEFSLDYDGSQFSLTDLVFTFDSFDVNGQPTGTNHSAVRPGSSASFNFDPSTGFFAAHFEGLLTNDLYPESNPIIYFSDVSGMLYPDGQTLRVSTTDPMIVPGVPGQSRASTGMGYMATRPIFDADSGLLHIADNTDLSASPDVSILRDMAGTYLSSETSAEPLVGAVFDIEPIQYLSMDGQGNYIFGDTTFTICNGSGQLATGHLTNIRIQADTFSFMCDVSSWTPGPLSSSYLDTWFNVSPSVQLLGPVATLDLVEGTTGSGAFSQSYTGHVDFVNGESVPAPPSLALCVIGLLTAGAFARRPRLHHGETTVVQ